MTPVIIDLPEEIAIRACDLLRFLTISFLKMREIKVPTGNEFDTCSNPLAIGILSLRQPAEWRGVKLMNRASSTPIRQLTEGRGEANTKGGFMKQTW